ncbi:hypothetical protein [Prosthecomicrobium sp. N25]|uniref:hypothetical protein n=1 Tax=Prosthecomicrobium sp. N25 TaxID=3129254 RepID=UPI003077B7A5
MRPTHATFAALLLPALAAPAAADTLEGREIDQTVRGRRIYLAVPLGGEFPLTYRPDGRVDGSGEAVGLGRVMRPKDSGRWWVDGRRLCQRWTTWYDGKVFCFTLRKTAPTQLAWTRDDGLSGTARIGD